MIDSLGHPSVRAVLDDPAASEALKTVIRDWLRRDPVDAANDADVLAAVFEAYSTDVLMSAALRPQE